VPALAGDPDRPALQAEPVQVEHGLVAEVDGEQAGRPPDPGGGRSAAEGGGDPALGGRLRQERGDRGRPLGRRPQRVAGGQRDRPHRAVGDQGIAGPDGDPIAAEGEVGE
jgi:hypothetical protein